MITNPIPVEKLLQNFLASQAAFRVSAIENLKEATRILGKVQEQEKDYIYLDFDKFSEDQPFTVLGLIENDIETVDKYQIRGIYLSTTDDDDIQIECYPYDVEEVNEKDIFCTHINNCSIEEIVEIFKFVLG